MRSREFVASSNQDLGITNERASQGQSLPLAAREPNTPIAKHRFEAIWQIFDELQRVRLASGLQ